MPTWDEQITAFENEIAKLKAEAYAFEDTLLKKSLTSLVVGVVIGLLIGLAL